MTDYTAPHERIPPASRAVAAMVRIRCLWRRTAVQRRALLVGFLLAACVWTAWGAVEYVIRLHERVADAEERAAAVYVNYRLKWLCRPFQRQPGVFLCVDPEVVARERS